MKKQKQTIEFFGMPGSGKSTLMRFISNNESNISLRWRNKAKIYKYIYKFFSIVKVLMCSPLISIKQSKLVHKTKQKTTADLVKVLADWFFTLYLLKNAQKSKRQAIFDQGIVQAIWSINLNAKEQLDIDSFLKDIQMPDLVIIIDVEESIIRKRLIERPGKQSRLEKDDFFSEENIDSWLKPFHIFDEIKQHLILSPIELIIVSNDDESQMQKNIDIFRKTICA